MNTMSHTAMVRAKHSDIHICCDLIEMSTEIAGQSHYCSHIKVSFLVSACSGERKVPTLEWRKGQRWLSPADNSQTVLLCARVLSP